MKLIDIHSPQDIKPLTIDDLKDLAKQMRAAIINYTSTICLLYTSPSPRD